MKRNLILPFSAALVFSMAALGSMAQPGGFRNGPGHSGPDYRQRAVPVAPFVIVDGEGRSFSYNNNRFDNYDAGQALSRKQRKRLERRYGYLPPLVMYVPDRFVNRSGLYVYNNGIVYHRDRDGYFHLDDRYYNDRWENYQDNDYRNNNYGYNRGRY